MSLGRKLLIIAGWSVAFVAGFGLIGGIVSFIFDVLGAVSSSVSGALYYVSWFVAGVFCGLLSYDSAGKSVSPPSDKDWTAGREASQTGLLVVLVQSAVLIALFFPAYLMSGELALTLTFFITVFASLVFGHFSLRPKAKR